MVGTVPTYRPVGRIKKTYTSTTTISKSTVPRGQYLQVPYRFLKLFFGDLLEAVPSSKWVPYVRTSSSTLFTFYYTTRTITVLRVWYRVES